MSRLDEIRKGVEAGGCDQCEGAAELLAIVALLIEEIPLEERLDNLNMQLYEGDYMNPKRREYLVKVQKALQLLL